MASLALAIATWDVVSVGGIMFGVLTAATGANTSQELAMRMRFSLENAFAGIRNK